MDLFLEIAGNFIIIMLFFGCPVIAEALKR